MRVIDSPIPQSNTQDFGIWSRQEQAPANISHDTVVYPSSPKQMRISLASRTSWTIHKRFQYGSSQTSSRQRSRMMLSSNEPAASRELACRFPKTSPIHTDGSFICKLSHMDRRTSHKTKERKNSFRPSCRALSKS